MIKKTYLNNNFSISAVIKNNKIRQILIFAHLCVSCFFNVYYDGTLEFPIVMNIGPRNCVEKLKEKSNVIINYLY